MTKMTRTEFFVFLEEHQSLKDFFYNAKESYENVMACIDELEGLGIQNGALSDEVEDDVLREILFERSGREFSPGVLKIASFILGIFNPKKGSRLRFGVCFFGSSKTMKAYGSYLRRESGVR